MLSTKLPGLDQRPNRRTGKSICQSWVMQEGERNSLKCWNHIFQELGKICLLPRANVEDLLAGRDRKKCRACFTRAGIRRHSSGDHLNTSDAAKEKLQQQLAL